jgi:hypothetical protein
LVVGVSGICCCPCISSFQPETLFCRQPSDRVPACASSVELRERFRTPAWNCCQRRRRMAGYGC